MTRAKDRDDVAYINHIRLANPTNSPTEVRFVIADARPMLSAAANRGFSLPFSPLSHLFPSIFEASPSSLPSQQWALDMRTQTIIKTQV